MTNYSAFSHSRLASELSSESGHIFAEQLHKVSSNHVFGGGGSNSHYSCIIDQWSSEALGLNPLSSSESNWHAASQPFRLT